MAGEVALLSRYTEDVGFDSRALARYIGNLEEGRSKVSVNSALSAGERDDYFRFRMAADGFARIRTGELLGEEGQGVQVAPDGSVRYQLLSASGQVLADSDPESGAEYEAWLAFTSDRNLELSRGAYTIRVSRGQIAANQEEFVYSFTLRSGEEPVTGDTPETAFREFLTTERPAPAGALFDQFASVTAVLGLFVDVQVF
jgi:hypothetical protein